MRSPGVTRVMAYCACRHEESIDVSDLPDELPVTDGFDCCLLPISIADLGSADIGNCCPPEGQAYNDRNAINGNGTPTHLRQQLERQCREDFDP
jgi:hypothetical protein